MDFGLYGTVPSKGGGGYGISLKRYERCLTRIFPMRRCLQKTTTEPALEPLEGGASTLQDPALDFRASKSIHV